MEKFGRKNATREHVYVDDGIGGNGKGGGLDGKSWGNGMGKGGLNRREGAGRMVCMVQGMKREGGAAHETYRFNLSLIHI